MKLLLDENLPRQMRLEIQAHEVFTVAYMGWAGIENGELLSLAASNGFAALITTDRGLEYEQHLPSLPLSVVVLQVKTNTIEAIRPLYPKILSSLVNMVPRSFSKLSDE